MPRYCPCCQIEIDPGTGDSTKCAVSLAGADGECKTCSKLKKDHYGSSMYCYRFGRVVEYVYTPDCCICYLDNESEERRQERMCKHCKERRSCMHRLEQELVSARLSRQDAIAKIEEVRKHIDNLGKPFAKRLDLVKCHYIFGKQELEPSAVDEMKQLLVGGELGSCYDSKEGKLDMSLRTDRMKRYVIRDLRMKSLPGWISKLGIAFQVIDVSGNPSLSRLPLVELCSMESSLKKVKCDSCVRLQLPPPEIASQGGEASLTYLKSVKKDSEANKRINLILIGNGEAGKTSVLEALRSKDGRAGKIDVDNRTIGIDLHRWEPEDADGLTFDVMDFGGQQIYAKTNQYFIVRRALYLLVWSVMPLSDIQTDTEVGTYVDKLKAMISTWLRAMQARVPGASVLLVATHIDLAEQLEVKDQCEEVRRCVEQELKKMSEEEDENILPLRVIREGASFTVDCLKGDGIKGLRDSVCMAAKGMLWWNETIPRPYLTLRKDVEQLAKTKPYTNAKHFLWMVNKAGVSTNEVKVVTSFLHDMGVIKYFGHDMKENQAQPDKGKYSIEDTIFIDPIWMIDVFKGVMRHDWQHLLNFFRQDPSKSKKTKKLLHLGIVDEDMFEYLWPQEGSDFWESTNNTLLSSGFTRTHLNVQQAVALLRGCDLAHFLAASETSDGETSEGKHKEWELLCPGIIPPFAHQHRLAVKESHSLCVHVECQYNIFPAGFTDRLVVLCAARHFEVDCSGTMAVMKGWGRTLLVSWSEDEDKHTLIAHASTKKQIENFEEDLKQLEAFFPGMIRRRREEKTSGEEVVQVGIFAYGEKSSKCARDIQEKIKCIYRKNSIPLEHSSVVYVSDDSNAQRPPNCLVNILCISNESEGSKTTENKFFQLWNELTASRAMIIPVVLADYQIRNYDKWWPEGIAGMERYKIFHKYEANDKSMQLLYNTIIQKLHQGQESDDDISSVTSQNRLLCEDCLHEISVSGDVGEYNLPQANQGIDKQDVMTRQQRFLTCTKDRHHRELKDVLKFNSSCSPCPSCLKQKKVPHFFPRPTCLTKLARELTAKIFCPGCSKDVNVLDVTPPQVFLSYNWGTNNSTQEMVRQVKRMIEEETSLQCWFDVEGGINAGEDHVKNMELGVSRCELFILFMSHKYVKSANCRREYVRACEAGKYIIPVFVPVLFKEASDSESGWRGDKGKEWWKSIADVEGKAAEGNKVDWNHLKHFPKTFNLSAGGGTDEIQVLGVEELVAAVQARVYRGDTVFHEEAQEEGEKRRPKKVLDRADHFLYEFRRLDLNGDGELSADELFEGLRFRMSQDEVSRLFDCMDANGDGRISMEEFIDARKKMIEDTIL